jgi:hypothetical protein
MFSPLQKGLMLAAAGLGLTAHPAAAQVIYQDNFSTGTAGSISGQQPSTDPSGATYTVLSTDNYSGTANGTSNITKTGGAGPATFALSSTNPAMVSAFLPYVVTATGPTVTISATVTMQADTTWFTLGFARNATSGPFDTGAGPGPWILVRGATGTDNYEAWTGPGTTTSSNGTIAALTPASFTFSETLNPVTRLFTARYNGTQFYSTTLAALPTINDVFFGTYVDNGATSGRTISSFSVSAAPEPSHSAALGLGVLILAGMGLVARRRTLTA